MCTRRTTRASCRRTLRSPKSASLACLFIRVRLVPCGCRINQLRREIHNIRQNQKLKERSKQGERKRSKAEAADDLTARKVAFQREMEMQQEQIRALKNQLNVLNQELGDQAVEVPTIRCPAETSFLLLKFCSSDRHRHTASFLRCWKQLFHACKPPRRPQLVTKRPPTTLSQLLIATLGSPRSMEKKRSLTMRGQPI